MLMEKLKVLVNMYNGKFAKADPHHRIFAVWMTMQHRRFSLRKSRAQPG
jgi:hypothetical protein